ncbi:hypothetical protein N7471_006906 [Penicillium samsonianum]|uniref:uncharacterized protein n=1 Tax=Penicillium samsonianum TaxID=1882272 RepID=UPI0025465D62|nr:uncharacterized protein N7471_006906 [Penicillium samsonianum]KAJ6131691.1 hypothetical protein N7471_006906 [Penicillium samsonianum]
MLPALAFGHRTPYTTQRRNEPASMGNKTDITLYTASTPNGIKVPILLEELGLEYKKQPWFLDINPNGRIPAMTDIWTDGEQIRVFESGAILEYLVDRYDGGYKVSYPKDSREYWEVKSWLMWQIGGLGPMQGQLEHFKKYAAKKIEYSINRYHDETRRLYRTMESHLAKSSYGFLVGDRLTIADIACLGWVSSHTSDGISLDELPHLEKWLDKLLERPGVKKGRDTLKRNTMFD